MKFTSVILSASLFAGAASAQGLVTAHDPQTVIGQLQSMGYRASYEPYDSGRPKVLTATAGINYNIAFYACAEDMTGCGSLLFWVGFDMPDGSDWTMVNDWNQTRVYSRAYLDADNDPYFMMPVVLAEDMSPEEFERVLGIWEDAIIDFTDQIGFDR